MQQKSNLKKVYKIHSKDLRKTGWNLIRPLEEALSDYPDTVVSIGDSQVLRFIDELNDVVDRDSQISEIKEELNFWKKRPKTRESKNRIKYLYSRLYHLQFQPDYMSVIMDRNSDYDRANKGFTVNGIKYKRFLGTNGGIKNSTIVYVNEKLYPELKKRLDNGRNKSVEMVPAKLEAYQALICSGSTPLPEPKGFIVVPDCITRFKDDVILIEDNPGGEPVMSYEDNYDIEHNDSDGYGFISPEYSRVVNRFITGDENADTIAGLNTRYAWTKGMVYTFDFVKFAEQVAGTYIVKDIWGNERDVRNADVILTESMLKLWSSYSNWEDYYSNCKENHYEFSTPKITPDTLENSRLTNYQFLEDIIMSDNDLQELCQPTIDEIRAVLGYDYRKSLVFLAGYGLNEHNIKKFDNDYVKALMIEPKLINDSFIRRNIYSMIKKRIELAKKGSVKVNANYAMISGDPYALAQSMFGLEVTGLLKAGEIYHKYWIDKGSDELACFRAPMTNKHSITKLKLQNTSEMQYWYRYMTSVVILNAWDTTCEAMNGADHDKLVALS